MAPDFEIVRVPDEDTPTTAEITNSSDTGIASKPEESRPFENAASLPSPTHARHHDQVFSKTRANFRDSPSSELSSPFTDFDTTHSRSDPVPLHFTTQRVGKMSRPPRLTSGDLMRMAAEGTGSQYRDSTFEIDDAYIYEAGIRSPGSRIHDYWADRPVGYVPSGWPTGPRMLPPGHYTCPHEGCEHPVGPTESGKGYNRLTLGPHILSHGIDKVTLAVHDRVTAMRCNLGLETGEAYPSPYYRHSPGYLLQVTDELIVDLEELKDWEQGDRFVRPWLARPLADDDSSRDGLRDELRDFLRGYKHDPFQAEAADEADDESVPHQNSKGFRDNRFRQARDELTRMRRDEERRPPWLDEYFTPSTEQFQNPHSSQEMAADSDGSNGPPRKKARKSRPQLDDSFDDFVATGGEEPMELD